MLANTATRLSILPEEAAKERVSRELARRSLSEFGQYSLSWWNPMPVHDLVCSYLEQVETFIRTEGKAGIGRLMVMMPPRHGKTWTASRLFPAWFLGRNPNCEVILTSYGADLAQDNSRAVRAIVTGNKYAAVFGEKSVVDEPVTLSEDSRSKANWDLSAPNRGGVVAAGVGGGITGKGAHLLVIDDPFKNREEAESESRRTLVMDWYRSSAYTRLEKSGAIVIMHTRWHREDLIGQLLREQILDPLADQWTVVCLPALAHEPGEYAKGAEDQRQAEAYGVYLDTADPLDRPAGQALCPEMFSDLQLQKTRAVIGEYDFAALYQQQPRPMEGGFFNEKDFEIVERGEVPQGLQWFRYVDLALGEKSTSDWNATIAIAFDPKTGVIYFRDLLHVQALPEFIDRLDALMQLSEERGCRFGFEDVAFQSLVLQEFLRRPALATVQMKPVKPNGDKVARARALQSRSTQGKVKLVRGPWLPELMRELMDFPKGKHDDMVDAMSGGMQMVEEMRQADEWLVYPEFDESMVTEAEPVSGAPIELAFQDGYIRPRAVLFIQEKENEILIFNEIYAEKQKVDDTCAEIKEKAGELVGSIELAAGDEGATELRKALREMDIPSRNKDHEQMQGIDVVKRLLASGRVKIHRRCTNLIYELSRGYIFPLNEQKREREQPLDANNQACKALEQWAYLRAR